jgi:hypothetical protein
MSFFVTRFICSVTRFVPQITRFGFAVTRHVLQVWRNPVLKMGETGYFGGLSGY